MLSQRKSILNHGDEQATWETITPKPSSSSTSLSRGKKVLNTCRSKQTALDIQSVSGNMACLELRGSQFQKIYQSQTSFLKPRGIYVKEDAMIPHSKRKKVPMTFLKKCYCLKTSAEGDMQHYLIDLDLETFNIQSVSFALAM